MRVRFIKRDKKIEISGINIPIPETKSIVQVEDMLGTVNHVEYEYLLTAAGNGIKDINVDIFLDYN